jgi:hypothetical protein
MMGYATGGQNDAVQSMGYATGGPNDAVPSGYFPIPFHPGTSHAMTPLWPIAHSPWIIPRPRQVGEDSADVAL